MDGNDRFEQLSCLYFRLGSHQQLYVTWLPSYLFRVTRIPNVTQRSTPKKKKMAVDNLCDFFFKLKSSVLVSNLTAAVQQQQQQQSHLLLRGTFSPFDGPRED